MLPVCALHSRPRNDANGNHNPVFKIVTWVLASQFMPSVDVPQIEAKPVAEIEAKPAAAIDPAAQR